MPEILRSRRQAGSWAARSARPLATSRAALTIVIARRGERPQASSWAGRGVGDRRWRWARRAARRRGSGAVAREQAALDRHRPPAVDQLLGDGPGQRLEGLGPAARAQPGLAPDDRAEQRVAPEAAVKGPKIVIGAQREAHALHGARRALAAGGLGADAHRASCDPRPHRGRLALHVQEAHEAVRPGLRITPSRPPAGHPVGADGHDVRSRRRMRRRSALQEVDVDEERAAWPARPHRGAWRQPAPPARQGARAGRAPEHSQSTKPRRRAGSRRWRPPPWRAPRPAAAGRAPRTGARPARAGAGPRPRPRPRGASSGRGRRARARRPSPDRCQRVGHEYRVTRVRSAPRSASSTRS